MEKYMSKEHNILVNFLYSEFLTLSSEDRENFLKLCYNSSRNEYNLATMGKFERRVFRGNED